jgi:hypothetical protein
MATRTRRGGLGSSPERHARDAAHELIRAESALDNVKTSTNCRTAFSAVKAARSALAAAGAHLRAGGEGSDPSLDRVYQRIERQVVRAEGTFVSSCVRR